MKLVFISYNILQFQIANKNTLKMAKAHKKQPHP